MRNPLSDDQDMIDHEASSWLVRIEENGLDREAQADFEAWLAADPRHETAYNEMRQTWSDIPELNDLAHLVAVTDPVEAPSLYRPPARRWRGAIFAGLGAFAAALIAVLALPTGFFSPHPQYATQIAETRIVTLPDGSSVTLGAKSSISVRFTDSERRVVLSGGEAFFDVVHNAARPFFVEAGDSVIQDIGTKFDVNLSDHTVRVSVLEGLVQVSRSGDKATVKPKLLRAGQRTELALVLPPTVKTQTAMVVAPAIVAQPAQAPGAWREGRLVFDNVRLADLAADVNRYYAPGVKLGSPDIADLRVTASFKTNEIPAFMSALSATLPVEADQNSGGTFTVTAARH